MFTKKDISDFVNTVRDFEIRMEQGYLRLHQEVSHESYKKVFAELAAQERQHMKKTDAILEIMNAE
ncbi:MAG: hypothetical protein AB9903_30755 [Vulcanimicrobiota bacterium]